MRIVLKDGIIDGCMFGQDLQKIDLDKENIYKKKKKFNVGFIAENKLKALQRRDLVKKEAVTNFLDNGRIKWLLCHCHIKEDVWKVTNWLCCSW